MRTNALFLYQEQFEMLMDAKKAEHIYDLENLITKFFRWRVEQGHNEPILLSIKRPGLPDSSPARDYALLAYGRTRLEGIVFPEPGENKYATGGRPASFGL